MYIDITKKVITRPPEGPEEEEVEQISKVFVGEVCLASICICTFS